MSRIPYIPLYIGDWEQDTNCLSLQAEAAWLKIIFKMHKDNKSGIYKSSTKALQNLWKCSEFVVNEIIDELVECNICDLEKSAGTIIFMNRRMLKDRDISEKRTKAVQKRYKSPTKHLQTTEYENEYESEVESKGKEESLKEEKPLDEPIVPVMVEEFKNVFPKYHHEQQKDFLAVFEIAKKIGEEKKYSSVQILSDGREYVLKRWKEIVFFIKGHKWYSTRSLEYLNKDWQQLIQTINANVNGTHKTARERQNAASAAVTDDLNKAIEFINGRKSDNAA